MEAVRKFDVEWKKQNAWEFLMRRVCLVLFYSIGSCLMLLPFGSSAWALVRSVMLFLGAMHFYIAPYMRCVENGKSVSLYVKLKWMPVSKREFLAVRRGYLRKFCVGTGVFLWILQQIGACLACTWGAENALFPLAFTAALYLVGIFDINRKLFQ